jgi:diguanylate cyclase (GGDEF)-like protein
MSLLSWFDNRTLFSCQLLLTMVFSIVFFGVRRAHPSLRGIGTIVCSFFLGVPGILLLFLRGAIPDLLSMTVANALVLTSFTLQYRATIRFLNVRRPLYPLLLADAAALSVVFYYSEVEHNIVPRIIAASIAIGLTRGLIAFELLSRSRNRFDIRLFGFAMALFAGLSCCRVVVSYLHGAPSNYMKTSPFQTLAMVGDVLYICMVGLFFFTVINGEILAQIRNQSEQDSLSGAFNRRGIELRLDAELKRSARSGGPLSVALIDVDHFKSINDSAGHAAGDDAIRKVVAAISTQLRAYDFVGRFGGDEFLLVLPQTTSTDALIVAERIRHAMDSFSVLSRGHSLTLSIGLTEALPGEHSPPALPRRPGPLPGEGRRPQLHPCRPSHPGRYGDGRAHAPHGELAPLRRPQPHPVLAHEDHPPPQASSVRAKFSLR